MRRPPLRRPFTCSSPTAGAALTRDSTAADNAEAFFDGTGYAGTGNVIPTVTTLTNLPAITAVQLLVDGKEADTLAGHVDLRRPFMKKVQ